MRNFGIIKNGQANCGNSLNDLTIIITVIMKTADNIITKSFKFPKSQSICYNKNSPSKRLQRLNEPNQIIFIRGKNNVADKIIHSRKHHYKLVGKESEIVSLYETGQSLTQIGKLYEVPMSTIYNLLVKLNIPRRSKSESTKLAMSDEHRQKQSQRRKGQVSPAKGKTWKLNHRKYSPKIIAENNPNWKGGKVSIEKAIRNSPEYKIWRAKVFERDNWTCVFCEQRKKNGKYITIQADHIKPFAQYPELRLNTENGRTLCVDCHKQTDTYGVSSRYKQF